MIPPVAAEGEIAFCAVNYSSKNLDLKSFQNDNIHKTSNLMLLSNKENYVIFPYNNNNNTIDIYSTGRMLSP